jgi:hypothetical protein
MRLLKNQGSLHSPILKDNVSGKINPNGMRQNSLKEISINKLIKQF